ncbi:amidase [Polymorphobacter multimanifer]|uniref:amidase n=1 Tax=Polymorphobacter multimanifer TaxID=1070431 RepID=UPI0016676B3D|nr:amidase [Polymorphobacter multimanifer]GGI93572.1 amidase [Polymorphobacter multimanifer]
MRTILAGTLMLAATMAQAQPVGPAETATLAALARIEARNPQVNAVLAITPDIAAQARAMDRQRMARGPLFGLPILIKDNIDVKGMPTTAGSLALKDNLSGRDAPLVARLRAAGAVIPGTTNLSEWANFRGDHSISGWSGLGGQVRNPHALGRTPCGSSSGSGAAVAAGMVDAAIGTETDGSVVCPASINGIVGFKPTVGLVSRTHVVPISSSQDTAGPMTRDVRLAARLLRALAGTDPADPATTQADARRTDYEAGLRPDAPRGVRIAVLRSATGWLKPVDALFETALGVLEAQGAVLVDVQAPEGRTAMGAAEYTVLLTELKAGLNAYLASTPAAVQVRSLTQAIAFNEANAAREMALFGQDDFTKAEATKGLTDPEYLKARTESLRLAGPDGIDAMLKSANAVALVAPTTSPAWMIDAAFGDQSPGRGSPTGYAAVAGYPHLTVPMGAVQGLPVGLSFVGAKWDDARMLALGFAYEAAAGIKLTPSFRASVEADPAIAPLLAPPR